MFYKIQIQNTETYFAFVKIKVKTVGHALKAKYIFEQKSVDSMWTVICGTNRPGNNTKVFAKHYHKLLVDKQIKSQYFSLEELPKEFAFKDTLSNVDKVDYEQKISQVIHNSLKFIFIVPEYNGSYPGTLKTFIDTIPPKLFHGKKAAIVGVASGRAGNLRGMDHLSDVLNHLNVTVLPNKIPISKIEDLIHESKLIDTNTDDLLKNQINEMMKF